jgi:dTDP-4-dehydrorhamnose 3,5-epimerase
MRSEKLGLDGLLLIHGHRFHDDRGFFSETYSAKKYLFELGIPAFVQDNLSHSKLNVFRGMHWQKNPQAQGKLVTCVLGSITDFVIDIRKSSPTFGQMVTVPLSDKELTSVWVPPGFAHGFLSTSEGAIVQYKVTEFWAPDHEASLCLEAKELERYSLKPEQLILSKKDAEAPLFAELVVSGDSLFE